MTTKVAQTAPTWHPSWCERPACKETLGEVVHQGPATTWRARGGYAEITLRLDRVDGDGVGERGNARIWLTVDDIEFENTSADVYLDREDARLLILFLQRHLDELDRNADDYPRYQYPDEEASANG